MRIALISAATVSVVVLGFALPFGETSVAEQPWDLPTYDGPPAGKVEILYTVVASEFDFPMEWLSRSWVEEVEPIEIGPDEWQRQYVQRGCDLFGVLHGELFRSCAEQLTRVAPGRIVELPFDDRLVVRWVADTESFQIKTGLSFSGVVDTDLVLECRESHVDHDDHRRDTSPNFRTLAPYWLDGHHVNRAGYGMMNLTPTMATFYANGDVDSRAGGDPAHLYVGVDERGDLWMWWAAS